MHPILSFIIAIGSAEKCHHVQHRYGAVIYGIRPIKVSDMGDRR